MKKPAQHWHIHVYRSKVEILWSNDKTDGYVIHVDECSQEANSCQVEVRNE